MSETQPQFNQINEQISKGSVIPATVLLERSDGTIDTGHAFHDLSHVQSGASSAENATVFLGQDTEGYTAHKTVPAEKLTDEYQQKLARELGGKALSGDSEDIHNDLRFDRMFGDTDPNWKPEDAAVRTETNDQRLQRERRMSDERDAAIKRVGRPEMN